MKKVLNYGVRALIVGGLLLSGFGVFNVGDRSLSTAEAAVSNPNKKTGATVYTKNIGKTKKVGKDAYREFNVSSRGFVDRLGTRAHFKLVFSSKYTDYATHNVTVYKMTDDKKYWTRLGTSSVSGKDRVFSTHGGSSSGTYYAEIKTYVKDSKGKTKTYRSITNTFTHSDKLK